MLAGLHAFLEAVGGIRFRAASSFTRLPTLRLQSQHHCLYVTILPPLHHPVSQPERFFAFRPLGLQRACLDNPGDLPSPGPAPSHSCKVPLAVKVTYSQVPGMEHVCLWWNIILPTIPTRRTHPQSFTHGKYFWYPETHLCPNFSRRAGAGKWSPASHGHRILGKKEA